MKQSGCDCDLPSLTDHNREAKRVCIFYSAMDTLLLNFHSFRILPRFTRTQNLQQTGPGMSAYHYRTEAERRQAKEDHEVSTYEALLS